MAAPNSTSTTNYLYNGDASDGILLGGSATNKVGFYGTTPVVQRASAVQAASVVSASSYITVGSNLAAWAAEVNATLTGLGLWKGAA
jgi:hypothetical protein